MISMRKMVWALVGIALLPLVLLAVLNARTVRRAALERSESAALSLAAAASRQQAQHFELARLRLEMLADLPDLRRARLDPEGCDRLLVRAAEMAGDGFSLLLLDPDGYPLCGSAEANPTVNFGDRAWFRRPLERGGFAAGDYILSRITDDALIVLGMPVEFEEGGTGVLGHGIQLDWLAEMLAETDLPAGTNLTVIDRDGTVLASYPTNRAGESFGDEDLLDAVFSRSTGVVDRGREGGIVTFQPLAPGIDNAFVIATLSTAGAFLEADGFFLRNLLALLLMAAALAALLLWVTGSFLQRPLEALASAFRQVERGNFATELSTDWRMDEMHQSALGFNRMTEALAERTVQLEERAKLTRLLYSITSQVSDTIEQRIERALELTCDLLDLELGIVSRIVGDTYTAEHVHARDEGPAPGSEFDLGSTYCALTVTERSVVALHHVAESRHAGHPAYLSLRLESYIGCSVYVEGRPYGTLNFSSADPRSTPFSEVEQEFVLLLARWVGSALERKRLDADLAASEARYRGVVTSLAEGVVVYDRDGAMVEANASALDNLGLSHDELMGRVTYDPEWITIRDDGSSSTFQEHPAMTTLRSGEPISGAVMGMRRPDGSLVWFLVNTRPLEIDVDGRPGSVVASYLDISARVRSEQAIVAEKLRFQAIFDSTFQFIGLLRPDGILLEANRTALEFAAIESHEVLGRPFWEAPWWNRRPESQLQLREAVAQAARGEFVRYNVEVDGAAGRTSVIDFSLKPVRDERGEVVLLVPEGRVIDEMIEAQRTLEHYAAELERSNGELQQFAYVASHDLKEPLRVISGYVGLLERRYAAQLDDDARDFIAFTVDASTRMAALIDALLELSRIGSRELVREEVPLERVLETVRSSLSYALTESGATLTVSALPTVLADEVQMTQLFQNLVSNAIKFRSEEPPRIEVVGERLLHGWRVTVSDNGIGIESAYFDRIFTIFQRLHTREQYEGTGIGLAVCKRIVERHGATIGVRSERGRGSTFSIDFPLGMVRHAAETDRDLVG